MTVKQSRRYITSVNIGKNGLTEEVFEEIKLVLKKKKAVRVKLLKSCVENIKKTTTTKEIYSQIAQKTNSKIEKAIGFVVFLKKN